MITQEYKGVTIKKMIHSKCKQYLYSSFLTLSVLTATPVRLLYI